MARQERLSQKVRSTPATLAQFGAIHKGWLLCTKLEARLIYYSSLAFGWAGKKDREQILSHLRSPLNCVHHSNTCGAPTRGVHPFHHL